MTTSATPGSRDPQALLRRAGVRPRTDRDQHFLTDARVLDRIPGYLPMSAAPESILEIGPGTGALTDRLLQLGRRVTAIERDGALARFLQEEFDAAIAAGRLTLLEADAVEAPWPEVDCCIANLPYSATSPLLFALLRRELPGVVMVQREVADRLCAEVGTAAYGRLTVTAGYHAAIAIAEPVPPSAFTPPPAVASAVITITPRPAPYPVADPDRFADVVRAVFTQRRKTLRNALRNTTHLSAIDGVDELLGGLDDALLRRRPATLAPAEYAALTEAVLAHEADG